MPNKSYYISNILPNEENNFILVGAFFDTLETKQDAGLVLSNMNSNLNVTNNTQYFFPESFKYVGLISNLAQGKILVGVSIRLQSPFPKPLIYIFKSDFDSLKAKFYLDNEDNGILLKLKALVNNNIWIIKALQRRYELLDSSLNVINTQIIPNNLSGNVGVKWDTDTSFYLVGDKLWPEPSHNLGFIHQYNPMDTTGHIFNEWGVSDTMDYPAVWNGIDFKNKDSIFIGGTRNFWSGWHNPWPSWFIILQTDSLLNIRWERFYGGDAYYVMCKLIATQDGGCLVAGTRYDYQNVTEEQTDIIILKLNSEGLLVNTDEKPVIPMYEALVYPNPGTNTIKVRVAAQYRQSLFRLFDMNGKLVLSKQIHGKLATVNTAFLKPGAYIYKITANNGLIETGKWIKRQ